MRSCAYRNEEELRRTAVMTTQVQEMSGGRNNRSGLAQELLRDDAYLDEGDQPSLMTLRRVVHEVLWVKDCASKYRRPGLKVVGGIVEILLLGCILVSTAMLMIDSFNYYNVMYPESNCWATCCLPTGKCTEEVCKEHAEEMDKPDHHCREAINFGEVRNVVLWVVTVIFTIEYLLRFWACVEDREFEDSIKGRLRWMRKPMSILDLMSIFPFYIIMIMEPSQMEGEGSTTVFRSMRLLRILAVLRLERTMSAWRLMIAVFSRKADELVVVIFVTSIFILLVSSLMFYIENDYNPEMFPHIPGSMWWAVNCIATIGYGDVYPKTAIGRIVGSMTAFVGIGLFALPAGILGAGFSECSEEFKKERLRRSAMAGAEVDGSERSSSVYTPSSSGQRSAAERGVDARLDAIERILQELVKAQVRHTEMLAKLVEDSKGSSVN